MYVLFTKQKSRDMRGRTTVIRNLNLTKQRPVTYMSAQSLRCLRQLPPRFCWVIRRLPTTCMLPSSEGWRLSTACMLSSGEGWRRQGDAADDERHGQVPGTRRKTRERCTYLRRHHTTGQFTYTNMCGLYSIQTWITFLTNICKVILFVRILYDGKVEVRTRARDISTKYWRSRGGASFLFLKQYNRFNYLLF